MNTRRRHSPRKRTRPAKPGLVLQLRLQKVQDDKVLDHEDRDLQLAELSDKQRELETSRDRYASLFDFAPLGYASLDRHGCVREINLEGARLLSRPRRQLLGHPILPLIVPADRRRWLNFLTGLRNGHERSSIELRITTKSGVPLVVRFYTARTTPHGLDGEGNVTFPAALVDVTAQHQAQESDRHHESRFRALIENAADTVSILDQTGTIRYQSPNVVTTLGYTAAELEGRKAFEFIHPDGVAEMQKLYAEVIAQPGRLRHSVARLRHKDGSWRWVEITGKNLLDDPAVRGVVLNSRDITEYRAAGEALRRKEHQLRLITGNTAAMLAQCSRDLRYVFVNRAYADQLGLAPKQIVGRPIREVLGEAAFEIILPSILAVLDGQPVEYEAEIPYRKVGPRFSHVAYRPDRDEKGNVVGWFEAITDITERRRAEEAVRASEARFRAMADGAPVLIWISGPDRLCTWFNKPWLDFSGRSLEQELGAGWAESVHPEDADACLKVYTRAFDARREFEREYRLRRHDGQWRWVLDRGTPLYSPDGKFAGFIGSCVDITDRKETELELRYQLQLVQNITEKAASCIFMTDERHHITFANPEAVRAFGYTSRELIGRPLHKILRRRVPGELPYPDGECPMLDVQRARGKMRDQQEIFLRKDGTPVAVDCSSAPLEVGGERVGAVFMMRDVTERVRNEEALRLAHDQLEARVTQRTEQLAHAHEQLRKRLAERAQLQEQILAAGESERARVAQDLHDGLCQLLLGIRFKMELLRRQLEERSLPGVNRLRALARLLDRATDEARGLARGLHPVEATPNGLMNALQELADSTSHLFNVNCQCLLPGTVMVTEYVVANHLFRIAQEAVTNAIKHGHATNISIELTREEKQLVLTVWNNGSPVSEHAGPGGLGLRTMDYRAAQIGATIELVSKADQEVVLRCVRPLPAKASSSVRKRLAPAARRPVKSSNRK